MYNNVSASTGNLPQALFQRFLRFRIATWCVWLPTAAGRLDKGPIALSDGVCAAQVRPSGIQDPGGCCRWWRPRSSNPGTRNLCRCCCSHWPGCSATSRELQALPRGAGPMPAAGRARPPQRRRRERRRQPAAEEAGEGGGGRPQPEAAAGTGAAKHGGGQRRFDPASAGTGGMGRGHALRGSGRR